MEVAVFFLWCLSPFWLIFLGGIAIRMFATGVLAVLVIEKFGDGRGLSLLFLGINLCEPLVNSIVIGLLVFYGPLSAIRDWTFLTVFTITMPMAILLAPVFAVARPELVPPEINNKLLLLGIGRWLLTAATWGSIMVLESGIGVMFFFVGVWLLWISMRWGVRQVDQLTAPHPETANSQAPH